MARDDHRRSPCSSPAQAPTEVKAEKASGAGGWLAPTRLRLDFQDRTLAEIVDGINAQGPAVAGAPPRAAARSPGRGRRPSRRPPRDSRSASRGPSPTGRPSTVSAGRRRPGPPRSTAPTAASASILVPPRPTAGSRRTTGPSASCVDGPYRSSRFQFAPYFFNQPGLEQPRADGSSRRPLLVARLHGHRRASTEDPPSGRAGRPRGG